MALGIKIFVVLVSGKGPKGLGRELGILEYLQSENLTS